MVAWAALLGLYEGQRICANWCLILFSLCNLHIKVPVRRNGAGCPSLTSMDFHVSLQKADVCFYDE